MHFAVTSRQGKNSVAVRSKAEDLSQHKLERYIVWGPCLVPPEAAFLLEPLFLSVLPETVPIWKVRIKKIAEALIFQGWTFGKATRLQNHAAARHAIAGSIEVPTPPLPEDITRWMEELSAMDIPANQLEKSTADVINAFDVLRDIGACHLEEYSLARVS